jgi:ornithine carbamoyltransferase
MKRDLVSLSSFSSAEIEQILTLTRELKRSTSLQPMIGKTAALIFEKPSLRTHVSFQVGVSQLGGQSVYLSQQHIGLATRESVQDIAEVLSRYNDLIVARTMLHQTVEDLARYATVPVINALTDLLHPCQILADAFTLRERNRFSPSTKIAFIGDGNNVVNSWLELAEKLPFRFTLACPKGYEPDRAILSRARAAGTSSIEIVHSPAEAARDANVLYTDVWTSMGQEKEQTARAEAFRGFQINAELLKLARPDCLVMHCLPAHPGEEITADILDRHRTVIMDEAENRLHVQKAIITFLLEKSHG